jgi:molybdopterin/thiamine biosynthesis adenylyltransferase
MRWWDRDARIRWELDELTRAGFTYESPANTEGAFTLVVCAGIDGEQHRLEIDFPDLYPYFRFEVRAPSLTLDHHQHPFGKNLCLMPRPTEHWEMSRSLASYLIEQLPKAVHAGQAAGATTEEVPQAEPVTNYFQYWDNAIVLIDGDWHLPDSFTAGRIMVSADWRETKNDPLRGVVAEIRTLGNEVLYTMPDHFQRRSHTIEGHIVKLNAPLLEEHPATFQSRIRSEYLRNERTFGRTSILAVIMPEEHAWRDRTGQGWLFIVGEKGKGYYFARAGRAGRNDLRARAPELHAVAEKTIALFGLGCLGGISAIELAKAGPRELRTLDHDYLEPGTLLRWYLGLPAAGLLKSSVISDFINQHYPLTKAVPYKYRLGGNIDQRVIKEMTAGASLIYDATAEPGVNYFLAEFARHHGLPYVHVSGTQGGWGGSVVRLNENTGCWYCLELAKTHGRIPPPPADVNGAVQPKGCGDPTFTGAGFDLATIALTGVRTAIASLGTGYPTQAWDVTVISLRDASGALITPRFDGFLLPKDPTCPACGSV